MPLPVRNSYDILLYPFSLVYGLIVWLRNTLFDLQIIRSAEFPIPVISVGNITVGGTGKTPHTEYLVDLLKEEFRVATLSRGYRRKTRSFILAGADPDVWEIGDEPVQIKNKYPETEVAVDRKRVNGIRQLLKRIPDLDVILLDDGYQHRYVKPGLSILLIDFNRPIWSDHLLPAGRLREPAYEKRRANIILITKCPDRLKPIERRIIVKDLKLYPFQHLYFTKLTYGQPVPVFSSSDPMSLSEIKALKPRILMVSGIAGPRLFKRHLRGISTHITEMNYPDHHDFSDRDLERITLTFHELEGKNKFIFTTEKDATRLRRFTGIETAVRERMYYVPLGIDFLNQDRDNFNNHIYSYVRDNKRNSILHKGKD